MAEHVMLVVAQEGDENSPLVAGALNLVGGTSKQSKTTRKRLAVSCISTNSV